MAATCWLTLAAIYPEELQAARTVLHRRAVAGAAFALEDPERGGRRAERALEAELLRSLVASAPDAVCGNRARPGPIALAGQARC